MKRILTIAIAAAALCGLPAAAQSTGQAQCTNTECTKTGCAKTECNKTDRHNRKHNPFEGITLTEQQKTALEGLKPVKCERDGKEKTSAGKQRPDHRQARRDYINGVKNILSPDQYVIFLENMVIESPAPRHHAAMSNKKQIHRDGKKMQRVEARHNFGNKENK